MLVFDYKGAKGEAHVESKTFPANTEALTDVLAFVEQILESYDCSMKIQTAICVAIEEVFVNVAHYAYGKEQGDIRLDVAFDKKTREITFTMADKGVAFDPLKRPDPDISLPAEKREIGGLGIFITKKTMDTVTYAYENGENILTMIKKI
jgi:anti-sigma regulatory factor (Ser/Thr protein kinase)